MTRALEPTRRARPRLLPGTWFALATAAISALAWLETSLARFPGHDRLFHPMFDRLFERLPDLTLATDAEPSKRNDDSCPPRRKREHSSREVGPLP